MFSRQWLLFIAKRFLKHLTLSCRGLLATIHMSSSANSSSSSPQPEYPTPAHSASLSPFPSTPSSSTTSFQNSTISKLKYKPTNIFSNDGSFLERFQRNKTEEQEKQKVKNELKRKINFEDRFRNRGKRKLPPSEDEDNESTVNSPSGTANTGSDVSNSQDDHPTKKPKTGEPLNGYQQELKKYQGSKTGLSDTGNGYRPLVK
ncbi:hypothetical protein D9756_005122 [Leucocoprinus leucothites]|uniref:Uncharacterized protein n=1 Tax=Leucocoprinus leucothites TaxID=201217 RepID=A0A8H5G9W7_9AGAR|nr:hypothetical protein D9756_005122 [Leucoagaricus leucothites]